MADPTVIVVGNEKGGAGKSTLAIHIVCGLLHAGRRVAIIDLDLRQRSMAKFFANRAAWMAGNGQVLPMPVEPDMGDGKALARADETEQMARFQAARLAKNLAIERWRRSRSMIATVLPACSRPQAMWMARVDLPAPPFSLPTTMTVGSAMTLDASDGRRLEARP